ncbi:DUF4442 domain-containing protein [Oceanospirillum sp. D5]|uniref:DUF4442 domain-containing protein n=2 Tax=Oceanospirillum sediminis TaxID=2760088 RepID=A0A839IMV7_9GAMM|nr:DUF4442 domain-containing protein [Oceanospirillum sediminis]
MSFRARLIKWGIALWPPLLGAGVKVEQLDSDFSYTRVRMKLRWYNRNYMGVHFGGSLYAMTDPFYVLMLAESLGKDFVVWDKSATIEYIKPGESTVWAEFTLPQGFLEKVHQKTRDGSKFLPEFDVFIKNAEGEVVARVRRTLYIRRKQKAVSLLADDKKADTAV